MWRFFGVPEDLIVGTVVPLDASKVSARRWCSREDPGYSTAGPVYSTMAFLAMTLRVETMPPEDQVIEVVFEEQRQDLVTQFDEANEFDNELDAVISCISNYR